MVRRSIVVVAVVVVLAGCDWSQFRAIAGHSGFQPFESKVAAGNVATLVQSWTAATGGAIGSSPAVANGTVYIGASDGTFDAFDASGLTNCTATTCAPLWTATTGGAITS